MRLMIRLRVLLGVVALVAFGGLLLGDDPKKTDTKPEPTATKHTIPTGWKALGLTDDQKKKIYAIEDEYQPKIAALEKQIKDLQSKEKSEKYNILTDDQKKRLKEIRDAQDTGEKKDEKKEEKKEDKKP
jgi:Spy/CpxP family protein refolding chaperone